MLQLKFNITYLDVDAAADADAADAAWCGQTLRLVFPSILVEESKHSKPQIVLSLVNYKCFIFLFSGK